MHGHFINFQSNVWYCRRPSHRKRSQINLLICCEKYPEVVRNIQKSGSRVQERSGPALEASKDSSTTKVTCKFYTCWEPFRIFFYIHLLHHSKCLRGFYTTVSWLLEGRGSFKKILRHIHVTGVSHLQILHLVPSLTRLFINRNCSRSLEEDPICLQMYSKFQQEKPCHA